MFLNQYSITENIDPIYFTFNVLYVDGNVSIKYFSDREGFVILAANRLIDLFNPANIICQSESNLFESCIKCTKINLPILYRVVSSDGTVDQIVAINILK